MNSGMKYSFGKSKIPRTIISTFGSLTTNDSYWGGDVATNGKIYCAPYQSGNILEIDPTTDTTRIIDASSIIGTFRQYRDAVGASNGKVYFIPYWNQQVLELDPATDTLTLIGDTGIGRYNEGIEADNGKIYCAPSVGFTNILEINPSTQSTRLIAIGQDSFNSIVKFSADRLYLIPASNSNIIEFSISTETITLFGNYTDPNKWKETVIIGNNIYAIPHGVNYMLEIDTTTNTATTFTLAGAGSFSWQGGKKGLDGLIYPIPYLGSNDVYAIDTLTESSSLAKAIGNGWRGSVQTSNGIIYGVPYYASSILKIETFQPQL